MPQEQLLWSLMSNNNIVLASASPRRSELLSQVGIEYEVIPSNIPEELLDGETPSEHVIRLAFQKASEVAGKVGGGKWVIGSDTVVIINDEILGKPEDRADAISMLKKLSGREHKVITGYSIINSSSAAEIKKAVETIVKFKRLTDDEIKGYVDSGEPMDKAGAYAIQGLGSFMVEGIVGSYSNVVGLPVCQIVNDLEALGAVSLFWQPQ